MVSETLLVPRRNATPASTLRRPSEPLRPMPAKKMVATTIALKTRRRRFTTAVPRRAGELGW